jgi:hypothetical protein
MNLTLKQKLTIRCSLQTQKRKNSTVNRLSKAYHELFTAEPKKDTHILAPSTHEHLNKGL